MRDARDHLRTLHLRGWAGGMAMIGAFLYGACWLGGSWVALALLPLYSVPRLTIGTLASCQRLLHSQPTKRIAVEDIEALPWFDRHAFAHRLRHVWRRRRSDEQEEEALVFAPGPGSLKKLGLWLLSFLPILAAMLLPLAVGTLWAGHGADTWGRLQDHALPVAAGGLALFTLYLIAFAVSKFAAHWRIGIAQATTPVAPAPPA